MRPVRAEFGGGYERAADTGPVSTQAETLRPGRGQIVVILPDFIQAPAASGVQLNSGDLQAVQADLVSTALGARRFRAMSSEICHREKRVDLVHLDHESDAAVPVCLGMGRDGEPSDHITGSFTTVADWKIGRHLSPAC